MSKALSRETLLAALAVLSVSCSKKDTAAPEPGPPAAAPAAASKAATVSDAPPPPTLATVAPEPAPAPAVDAGKEHAGPRPARKASASCGATGCSAEMKKK